MEQVAARDRPALERTRELLASVVQSAHDAIFAMGLDRRILTWNPAAERLYGYTEAEMVGRLVDVLIPEERRRDDREIVELVAAGGRLDRFRTRRIRRDASTVTVSLTVSPLTDQDRTIIGVVVIARHVSERERLEDRVQAVLEAAPDAVLGIDTAGRIVLSNGQAERLFGRERHDLLGMPVKLLLPDELPEVAAGPDPPEAAAHPAQAHRRDGSTVTVEVSVSSLDTDDGLIRCAVVRDITERLQAQAEQASLRAEADRQRREVQTHRAQRLESLGHLAGGVAHDFNNLVAVIANYAAFIVEEGGDTTPDVETMVNDARQILRAGERATELTHQLLAFARREVVRPQVLDPNQVVRDVEQLLHRSIGEHITLTTDLAPDLPAVTADPGQLEQVLLNLAVNARDAMPQGGQLRLDTSLVDVEPGYAPDRPALQARRYVRLRVSDTGTGMPREVIERAFEPFFTTKASGEGTGLGLATAYGIVIQAGGDIRIYSEEGMGTTITILLPATDELPQSPVDSPDTSAARGEGETILVVEDEAALRTVVERILASQGYQVLSAANGPAALEVAAAHEGRVHVLLTDVIMPTMLGHELAGRINAVRPDTAVIYMSGYAQPVLTSHGTLGADITLIEKPFTKADLLAAVRQAIRTT